MEWISVKNRLPKLDEYVLLYAPEYNEYAFDGPKIFVGFRGNYGLEKAWGCAWGDKYCPFEFEEITHWAELPVEPKVT